MSKIECNSKSSDYCVHIYYTVGEGVNRDVVDKEVAVTKDFYHAYMRAIWAEKKAKERKSRCRISRGNGKIKRCTDKCSNCTHLRSGSELSFEGLEEAGDYKADTTPDVEDVVVYNEFLEKLSEVLGELNPENRYIVQAIMDGQQDRNIAKDLGRPASTFSYQKKKLLTKLKESLGDFKDINFF